MAKPAVSVVVPTYRRSESLRRLLGSLREQTLARDRFEVVVVDDGGDEGTERLLRRLEADGDLNLTWLPWRSNLGPAAARNRGWRHARGELIAFTDDDCVAHPGWLEAGLALAASNPEAIIQGVTRPDIAAGRAPGLLERTVNVDTLGPQFETCNIFYPRGVLEALDGFDERYGRRPAAEDTDLAWRAIESGRRAVFAQKAIVLHAVERVGARGMLSIARRWERAVRVFAEHPGSRSMLHRRVFWNVWHYLMWRSLAALAAPAWLRRLVWARHLLELRRRARRAGAGSWAVPFLFFHDLVECWAIARGALRYRAPVL